jgi:predicted metal-binding transcription factor (methanogenesis marker protein 9)
MARFNGYAVLGSLAVLMFSCVSTPQLVEPIAAARASIERVAAMPLAEETAQQEIAAARTALSEAEAMDAENRSAKDIASAAELAKQHAEIAEQQIAVARAKQAIESAELEWQAHWIAADVNSKR